MRGARVAVAEGDASRRASTEPAATSCWPAWSEGHRCFGVAACYSKPVGADMSEKNLRALDQLQQRVFETLRVQDLQYLRQAKMGGKVGNTLY